MQRHLITVLAAAAVLAMIACGGGAYDDAIKVNQDFVDAMETYLDGIEQADSGSAMAAAINTYAEAIDALAPRMKAVAQKYPEWKDQDKIPEALRPLTRKSQSLAKRMGASFMKAANYMGDAEVQAAQQRLAASMAKMQ